MATEFEAAEGKSLEFDLSILSGRENDTPSSYRYLNSNNTNFGGRKWACKRMAFDKNMEESRRNKILLIKFRKSRNSARKRTLGSSICMTLKRRIRHWHILLPLLRWSAACSREKCSIPGKTIPWKGVERWEGGIGGNARRRTCYDGGNLLPRLGGSRWGEAGYGLDRVGFP